MLLTIDVGNTQTVIGLYDDDDDRSTAEVGLLEHWRIATDDARTADEHVVVIGNLLRSAGYDLDVPGVSVCSGVPRVLASLREMIDRYTDADHVVIEPGVRTGM
ncbi:MAG: type III pantothenate kinase, partial [Acidimicrobiales bacterium]|nr:type III pantothenate kinase [Acidimicrobiales bacterium]